MKFHLLPFLFLYLGAGAQQVADTTFKPPISKPEYAFNHGPTIYIDEGHNNFHTKKGRYSPFANLLQRDGYRVDPYIGKFEIDKLNKGKILVIANALNEINASNWYLPTPSAFTKEEIEIVKLWVSNGGNLFLIADHMPMAGAATDLAYAFGFEFTNGFAVDTSNRGNDFFTLQSGSLVESQITNGRNENEKVKSIVSFTGQAFQPPADAKPVLVFGEKYLNLLPDTAWIINNNTLIRSARGLCQGAYKDFGKGRIVVFGEAAMFSAQLAGPNRRKTGMNAEFAKENYKLLLNIIHWLDHRF